MELPNIPNLVPSFNLNDWIDKIISIVYKFIKLPLDLWNKLPVWAHWIVYVIIFLIAVFFAWITIRYHDAWRYRA